MVYLLIRNKSFDQEHEDLAKINIEDDNYSDLYSKFNESYGTYGNIDGIIIILAFFSFINYISKVSNTLNCYFQMIIQVCLFFNYNFIISNVSSQKTHHPLPL